MLPILAVGGLLQPQARGLHKLIYDVGTKPLTMTTAPCLPIGTIARPTGCSILEDLAMPGNMPHRSQRDRCCEG